MMRSVLLLACVSSASAVNEVQCTYNAAQAVDEIMDAAVFMWAAVERCGKSNSQIDCTVDVATTIQSLNGMANVIIKALDDCGGIKTDSCGAAAGQLTEAIAGLTAAGGGVVDQCSSRSRQNDHPGGDMILCVVNVKDTTRSLLQMVQRSIDANKECKGTGTVQNRTISLLAGHETAECGADAMSVISALAAMGQYISGSVARCAPQPLNEQTEVDLDCSKQVSAFVRHASGIAAAATRMSFECGQSSSRLYELAQHADKAATSTSPVTLALFAFLPLTAVVAFVGGNRFAKARENSEQEREVELTNGLE
jgi:hypothetical protein